MKEIAQVQLINFQSHKDTTIDFCNGLNVFVGESRNGKTAILRALRWLYYNEPRGDRFIRSGEDQCEVSVLLNDGTQIQRIRNASGKVNVYVLNEPGKEEQVFTKFNKEVPLEIQEALGVSKLVLDKDTAIELNFSRQMDSAFLVNDSGPRRTKIIGRVVNLHVIDSAQRTAENDLKIAKREKSKFEDDIKSLEEKLAEFKDLPAQEAALKKAFELMKEVSDLKVKTEKLQEINTAIQRTQLSIAENDKVLDRLKNIELSLVLTQTLTSKVNLLANYKELQQKITGTANCLDIQRAIITKLSNLEATVKIFDEVTEKTGRLANLQSVAQSITCTESKLKTQQAQLEKLQSLEMASSISANIKKKYNTLLMLSELKTKILDNEVRVRAYQGIIAKTQDTARAQEIIATLHVLRERGYKLSEVEIQIKRTRLQLNAVTERIKNLNELDKAKQTLERAQIVIGKVQTLRDHNNQIKNQVSKYTAAQQRTADMEQKYLVLREDYTDALKQNDICPICHTAMTPEIITQLTSEL